MCLNFIIIIITAENRQADIEREALTITRTSERLKNFIMLLNDTNHYYDSSKQK